MYPPHVSVLLHLVCMYVCVDNFEVLSINIVGDEI